MSNSPKSISFERRDGRITISDWRVVVTVGGRTGYGPWCFTKRDARTHVEEVKRSLFDEDEAEWRLAAESARRTVRARVHLEHDRSIRYV